MKLILNERQYNLLKESPSPKIKKIGDFDIPDFNKIDDMIDWLASNRTKFIRSLSDVTTDAQKKFNAMESLFDAARKGDIKPGDMLNGIPVEQYITRQGGMRDDFIRLSKSKPTVKLSNEISNVRTVDDYINKVKESFPMTEDEAMSYIQSYVRNGGNPNNDFNKLGLGTPGGDDIKMAIFLKNKELIPPLPIGEYLYHGTDTRALNNIKKTGRLENVLGPEANKGALARVDGKTTATGDISKATTYSLTTSQEYGSEPILLRFDNTTNEKINYFSLHDAVDAKRLEYSSDGGKTWQKVVQ